MLGLLDSHRAAALSLDIPTACPRIAEMPVVSNIQSDRSGSVLPV